MIQAIKCKGGQIFAGCHEPHCYEDSEWMKELRKYVKAGCTVEMIEAGKFSFGNCDCGAKSATCKLKETPQPDLFTVTA